jgi:hypothetical protein
MLVGWSGDRLYRGNEGLMNILDRPLLLRKQARRAWEYEGV